MMMMVVVVVVVHFHGGLRMGVGTTKVSPRTIRIDKVYCSRCSSLPLPRFEGALEGLSIPRIVLCVCKVLIFTISLFWEKLSLELEVGRGKLEGLYIIIMLMSFQEAGELSVEPETIVHVFTYIITV